MFLPPYSLVFFLIFLIFQSDSGDGPSPFPLRPQSCIHSPYG